MNPTPTVFTLITGASSALGQSIALRLAGSRSLILHGRSIDTLERVRERCPSPANHRLWLCDFKHADQIESSFSSVLASNGATVSALVHCAGVAPLQPMRLADLALIEQTMRVNFTSVALLVSLLTRRKINHDALRSIIFLSSIASRSGVSGFNLYSASKGALDALMRSLAVELAPTVRVNSVLPGGLPPKQGHPAAEEIAAAIKAATPLGLGSVEDVSGTVEFLLSDNARWITGQQLVVDGGFTTDATLR